MGNLAVGDRVVVPFPIACGNCNACAAGERRSAASAAWSLLLYVTSSLAHRPVTTEPPLIVVWATAQLAAGITLRTAGVLSAWAASAWIVATEIATLVGLACYLIFYRLDPIPAYWIGMVPLVVDGVLRRSWPQS